jgi:hypothetical protein
MAAEHSAKSIRQFIRRRVGLGFESGQNRSARFRDHSDAARRMVAAGTDEPPLKAFHCRQVKPVIFLNLPPQSFQLFSV